MGGYERTGPGLPLPELDARYQGIGTSVVLPASTEQHIYVSAGAKGNDANDGLAWGSAKATVAAALTALGGNPGVIELGYGTFTISAADGNGNGVTLAAGQHLRGQGNNGTILRITTAVTWGVKLQGSRSSFESCYLQTTAAVTYGCGVSPAAHPGSCQHTTLRDLWVNVGANMTAMYALGPDFAGASDVDIANTVIDHCAGDISAGTCTNGFLFGNGTAGNVLQQDVRASGCAGTTYGVTLAGCGVRWFGGGFSNITTADIRITKPASDSVVFTGTRFENGNTLLLAGYVGPISSGVVLIECTALAFTPTDGVTIIDFAPTGPLTLIGGYYSTTGGATVFAINKSGGTPARQFTAINVTTDNATPYPAQDPTHINRAIIGAQKISGGNPTPIAGFQLLVDGTDPFGFGFPTTSLSASAQSQTHSASNYAIYRRSYGAGPVSSVRIRVSVQSGNLSVRCYAGTGSGLARKPGAALGTGSGAVSCPAVGLADVALGATVNMAVADYFGISADNTTISIVCEAQGVFATGTINGHGRQFYESAAHPLPATATPLPTVGQLWIMDGVP